MWKINVIYDGYTRTHFPQNPRGPLKYNLVSRRDQGILKYTLNKYFLVEPKYTLNADFTLFPTNFTP